MYGVPLRICYNNVTISLLNPTHEWRKFLRRLTFYMKPQAHMTQYSVMYDCDEAIVFLSTPSSNVTTLWSSSLCQLQQRNSSNGSSNNSLAKLFVFLFFLPIQPFSEHYARYFLPFNIDKVDNNLLDCAFQSFINSKTSVQCSFSTHGPFLCYNEGPLNFFLTSEFLLVRHFFLHRICEMKENQFEDCKKFRFEFQYETIC